MVSVVSWEKVLIRILPKQRNITNFQLIKVIQPVSIIMDSVFSMERVLEKILKKLEDISNFWQIKAIWAVARRSRDQNETIVQFIKLMINSASGTVTICS